MLQDTLLAQRGPDPRASDDRRAELRHLVDARARCRGGSGAEAWTGRIRDVSSLGLGMLVREEVKVGSFLDIDLENNKGNWIGAVRGRVVHVEPAEEGQWLVGCAFVAELDDAELRYFRAEKIPPVGPDTRRWVRYPCDVETVLYTAETVPGERRRAQIVNISASGVGLLLPCEFSEGTVLRLELPLSAAEPPRLLLLRVIRCERYGKRGWFLGCEFADQLGAAQLRGLLDA